VTTKEVQRRPSPPFITSSLQQEASRKLGMPAKKTMQVAQNLYEGVEPFGGLITYMRTDSTNVAAEAQATARKVISGRFGGQYVPASPPVYQKKVAGAQEAHEAIRPTHPERDPESLSGKLDRDQLRLYTLIWRRFIASQMANAVLDQTSVDIGAGPGGSTGSNAPRPYTFRASGSVIKFQGFLAVYREGRDAGDPDDDLDKNALPLLEQGEGVDLIKLWPEQHFTQPPPRYTEPTLVKALEEKGIGRPSTYASILSTIQEREYVEMNDKKFQPTSLGETVNDLLVARFPRIVNVGFTAAMEGELDEVAEGKRAWLPVVAGFYGPLVQALEEARQSVGRAQVQERGKGPGQGRVQLAGMAGTGTGTGKPSKPAPQRQPQPTGEECPQCGSPLVVREGQYGPFTACSGYPRCKYNKKDRPSGWQGQGQGPGAGTGPGSLVSPGSARVVGSGQAVQMPQALAPCPACGQGGVVEKKTRWGSTFYSCNRFPACRYASNSAPVNGVAAPPSPAPSAPSAPPRPPAGRSKATGGSGTTASRARGGSRGGRGGRGASDRAGTATTSASGPMPKWTGRGRS
jgi:DNA topoisomerase-1